MLLQLLTFLQIEGNTDKTTEATHRKMPRCNAIDSSCFRRHREANARSDFTSTGCFRSLFSGRGATKVSREDPEWLRNHIVNANVGKLEKATCTPNSEEIVTTRVSSTVLVSSTLLQSNPSPEISVAEVATLLQEDKNSGRFEEKGFMGNRRESDDVNEEKKGGGNQDGQEAEKGEGLEQVAAEQDEQDEEEDFKLLESEWQRFKCRLDHDSVATMQMLFRADHTVSFGTRVKFQGSPPNPLAPHFCRPVTDLPARKPFLPSPLEITGDEDAA
eukprot:g70376.t1